VYSVKSPASHIPTHAKIGHREVTIGLIGLIKDRKKYEMGN